MPIKLLGVNEIDYKNIDAAYIQNVARVLLLNHTLCVPASNGVVHEFKLGEIEFYVKSDTHDDKYTHGDANQKEYGKWYFHRYKTGAYKSGTYKGVDFTLGSDSTYFGILIRSIYDPNTGLHIEGPCKVVNKILELSGGYGDVKTFMINKVNPLDATATTSFHLKESPNAVNEDIYTGPRIGLSDKHPEWKNVNYRFLVKKNLIKKGKKYLVKI